MNSMKTDVLVIGAGPAGSAAAKALATRGLDVALVDRSAFPRNKVCGDALIPDALNALSRLALKDQVLRQARRLGAVRIYAPNGAHIAVAGDCACLPRRLLDDMLRQAAVEAGARFMPRYRVIAPLERSATVTGAVLQDLETKHVVSVGARVTLLATGAAAEPLKLFGVLQRQEPSAIAARVYLKVDPEVESSFDFLCISYDRAVCPGYVWIFPGPDHVFNVGVGYFYDAESLPVVTNIRRLLERFLAGFPPAAELVRASKRLTEVGGAPLRTGLSGAALQRPGLLVIGEGAGLTYPCSGEGIGKALESALLASDILVQGLEAHDPGTLGQVYAACLVSRFRDRFRAYKVAQDWVANQRVVNFLAWRARSGNYVKERLAGFLDETSDPRELFSSWGLLRALMS